MHLASLLALASVSAAPAQEPETAPAPKPTIEAPELPGMSSEQEEMIRLFHEVERTLASIDVELFDASAGRIPIPEGRESGIERLLRSNGEKSDSAVAGIEQILELAQQMGAKSMTQCMKPGEPQQGEGKSPLDQERQRGPTQGEKTPDAPKPDPQSEKPGDDPTKPKPGGEKPDDRGKNPPPGENRPSQPRVDERGEAVPAGDDADRWGTLPERVRQVFQNQITDDLPLQYRDWIDSYYRRLNQTR